MARRLGVTSCRIRVNRSEEPRCKGVDGIGRVDGSSIIGSNEISTLDLATSYATLAARGRRCDPHFLLSITRRVGGADRPLPFGVGSQCQQVLDPRIADTVSAVLQGVINHGTGRGNGQIDRPAAAKTGTAEGFSTASFAGYIPQLATAVTLADPRGPTAHPLRNVEGSRVVYGGGFPAQIWARTMTGTINGLNLPVEPLPAPDETRPAVPKKVLPSVLGLSQQIAETLLRSQGFNVRSEPVADGGVPGTVVGMSPAPGTEIPLNTRVVLRISGGLTGVPVFPGRGRDGGPIGGFTPDGATTGTDQTPTGGGQTTTGTDQPATVTQPGTGHGGGRR
jgi:membrane peptidoglycan carboxypeptidase